MFADIHPADFTFSLILKESISQCQPENISQRITRKCDSTSDDQRQRERDKETERDFLELNIIGTDK